MRPGKQTSFWEVKAPLCPPSQQHPPNLRHRFQESIQVTCLYVLKPVRSLKFTDNPAVRSYCIFQTAEPGLTKLVRSTSEAF